MKQCLKILVLILGLSFLATSCVKRNRDADATSPFLGTWVDSTYLNSYRKSKNADSLCYLGKNSNGKVQYNVSIQTINVRGGIQYGQLDLKSLKTDYSEDRTSEVSNSGVIRGYQKESYKYTYSLSEDGKKLTSRFYYADPQGVMKASEEEFDLYNSDEFSLISKDIEKCYGTSIGGDNVDTDKDITAKFLSIVNGRYEMTSRTFLEFNDEGSNISKDHIQINFIKKSNPRSSKLVHNPEKYATSGFYLQCRGSAIVDLFTVRERKSLESAVTFNGVPYKVNGGNFYMTYSSDVADFSEATIFYYPQDPYKKIPLTESEFNKTFAFELCEEFFVKIVKIEFMVLFDTEKIVFTSGDFNSENGPYELTYRKVTK